MARAILSEKKYATKFITPANTEGHHHALLPAEHLADPQQQPGEDRKK